MHCTLSEPPAGTTTNTGLIVGVVIGWTVAVTVSAVLLFVVWRTRKMSGESNESACRTGVTSFCFYNIAD